MVQRMQAHCQCGALSASVPRVSDQIVACHCKACQRRSGSPFGLIAYYPQDDVVLAGEPASYTRMTESGGAFTNFFCATCGGTVWCTVSIKPDVIGIPVGAFADPAHPAPVRSVWEETRHPWVALPPGILHYPKGRAS